MPTAYMVTTGSYSDYSVRAVFTTRDKAEEFLRLFPDDMYDPRVEEIPLDDFCGHPPGRLRYYVRFDKDGNSSARHVDPDDGTEECVPYGDGETMGTYCWATDEEHAIKTGNERRAMVIAAGQWETNFNAWRERRRVSSVS